MIERLKGNLASNFSQSLSHAPLELSATQPLNTVLIADMHYSHRDHPASDVYVTGTFDNWSKSEKLIKTGDHFAKDVTLPDASEKIYYKVRQKLYHGIYHTPSENSESSQTKSTESHDPEQAVATCNPAALIMTKRLFQV